MSKVIQSIVLNTKNSTQDNLIVTLFAPSGVLPCFVKHGASMRCHFREIITPLTLGWYDISYVPPKMAKIKDAQLLNTFYEIKNNYDFLIAAGRMLDAITKSQWKEKPAPKLYSLLVNFLYRIPLATQPMLFASVFTLKLLQHEGYLDTSVKCCKCSSSTFEDKIVFFKGQKFCKAHAPQGHNGTTVTKEEHTFIQALIQAKKFDIILSLMQFNVDLSNKIFDIFESCLQLS